MNVDNEKNDDRASLLKRGQEQGEIDLFDLIFQLWKGKVTIILAAAIAVMLGIGYLIIVKEKWTSTATVTLPAAGQVANYNAALAVVYADSPQDKPSITSLQAQLFGRFSASMSALSSALKNLQEPMTLQVENVIGSNDALNISFIGPTSKDAQLQLNRFINQVNDAVVKDYGDDIKRNLSVKTRELTNTLDTLKQVALDKKEHRISVIKQALKIAEASTVNKLQVNQAEFLSDDTLYLLGSDALNAMVANEQTKPLEYSKDYYDAQRALLALTHLKVEVENLNSFRYISEANLPIRRDSPKSVVIVILSLILGCLIGTILVLGRNAVRVYNLRK